jgi:hypothetical protein
MTLKGLFIVAAIVSIIFGIVLIAIPTQVYALYGVASDATLNYMGQLFGAALIAIGLVSWKARDAADSEARRAIIFSFFVADTVGFVVALIGQLHKVVNALGWTTVAIYLLFSLGFAYYQFSQPVSVK